MDNPLRPWETVKLRLKRPLVTFDLEATGISTLHDRIVQVSVAKHLPDGKMDVRTRLINPEMPIPPESTEVHGVTDQDVRDMPTFCQVAKSFHAYLEGCDLAGFNIIQFDIPMLIQEFARAGIAFSMTDRRILDAYQIFRKREPRTLEAALHFYCGETHDDAHDSEADVLATIKVIEGQLHKYQDLPPDVDKLDSMFNPHRGKYIDWEGKLRWEKGEVVLGFGKKIGTRLKELVASDAGFLEWMLRSDFSPEVKRIITDAFDGKYPTPPVATEPVADAAADDVAPNQAE